MKRLAPAALSLLGCLCCWQSPARAELAPPGSSPDRELFTYTIEPGDNCESIAERFYGAARFYYVIIEYNPGPSNILRSTCDRSLRPGSTLRLPRRVPAARRPADAQVTAVMRKVRSRAPSAQRWDKARPGQDLFRGWRVNTLERSAADLEFSDTSTVHLREETLVIIFGPSARDARRRTSKATLERGTLRARLGELSGRKRLDVTTPTAHTELSGGDAVVSVDREKTSRIANHSGRPARVAAAKGGNHVLVQAGMGTTVRRGKRPTPPQPLPSTPHWLPDQPRLFVAIGESGAAISAAWRPLSGTAHYRIEVTSGPNGEGPVGSTGVPGRVNRFELRGFPAGEYHVTVAAIDEQGLESAPSETLELRLVQPELQASELARLQQPTGAPGRPDGPPRVRAATRLVAPPGMRCAIGESELAQEVVFSGGGIATLSCEDAEGRRTPRTLVEVMPLELIPRDEAGDEAVRQLTRGEQVTLRLEGIDASGMPRDSIAAMGGPGLQVEGVALVPGETGTLELTVTAALDAPPESYIELQLRPRGARRVVLGRVALGVDAPLVPQPVGPEPTPTPPPPPPRPVTEASALVVGPTAFGVRDEQRRGHGLWAAVGYGAFYDDHPGRLSPALGLRLALAGERLRVDLGVPLPPIEGRAGGLYVGVQSLVLTGPLFGVAVELAGWLPFTVDETSDRYAVRFVPSADLSFRLGERTTLRTRQGLMADAGAEGALLWSSAYAADFLIAGPLTLGIEGILLLGRDGDDLLAAPAAAATAGVVLGPIVLTLAGRFALTDDAGDLFGDFTVLLAMRANSRQ